MNKRRVEASVWENQMDNFAALSTELLLKFRKCTFAPSRELLLELKKNYVKPVIEEYDNGKTFSAYKIYYSKGDEQKELIFKTTDNSYPIFHPYESVEDYKKSFTTRG